MNSGSSSVAIIVLTGLSAAVGSILTAVVQGLSKHGESRAIAADRVTHAAGNIADRLDQMNLALGKEVAGLRRIITDLVEANLDDLINPTDETRQKVREAVHAAQLGLQ